MEFRSESRNIFIEPKGIDFFENQRIFSYFCAHKQIPYHAMNIERYSAMTIAQKHLMECAEETGIDTEDYFSGEKKEKYLNYEIESFYDENSNSSFSAWKAFAKGIGTKSAPSREEAIAEMKYEIENMD